MLRLAEHLFSWPMVTARMVARLINVTAPTANAAIRALVERGDLEEISGRERNRLYQATKIFEAVYGPVDSSEQATEGSGKA